MAVGTLILIVNSVWNLSKLVKSMTVLDNHICMYVCAYVYICVHFVHTCIVIYRSMITHTYVYRYTYTYVYVYIRMHIEMHIDSYAGIYGCVYTVDSWTTQV